LYATLKIIHVGTVALSAVGFVLRYALTVLGRHPHGVAARMAPHVVDSILLASALGLLWTGGLNPLESPWLEAKIVGLVIYIVAGSFVLKRGRTAGARAVAFVIALGTLAWIVSVAVSKSPWGPLAGLAER
jgi:uncharacterized membrane protein SirB2